MSTGTREQTEARRLRAALEHAIDVIESYQMDLRNSNRAGIIVSGEGDKTLAEIGFCQGSTYRKAVDRIRRIAEGTLTV